MESMRFLLNKVRRFKRAVQRVEHPTETVLKTTIYCLRLIGVWPRAAQKPNIYSAGNTVFTAALMFFIFTITCDLYEASSNFITFGDDLCVLVALYMIFFKLIMYRIYKTKIEWIASEFESMHRKFARGSPAVREIQRCGFVLDVAMLYTYMLLGYILFIVIAFQPLLSGQSRTLPFRAKFPFSIEDKTVFVGVYVFQCACTLINVKLILFIDNIGCVFITQSSVNLKILCQRIRELSHTTMSRSELGDVVADHQRIIRVVDYINECYYLNYMAQIAASTFLICLTAFEAQLAHDQPLVALKFETFMFSAFMQLFYWCWTGSRVQVDSLDVAKAAYECDWLSQSKEFRRDLSLVIQRAQKPLSFGAQPFSGFDFQSFANILSSSYSYFTLLRTLND